MLWIVCILHCSEYIIDCPWQFNDPLFVDITYGVIATFVFLSGFFVGKKGFPNRRSILEFYGRRLKSLYIPFVISCTTMFAMHYLWGTMYIFSVKQYTLSLVGMSMLIPPAPSTVWFVVFMLQCYLVAPHIVRCQNRVVACIIWYSCIAIIHSMTKNLWGIEADARINLFLPVFLLGLCMSEKISENIKVSHLIMSIVLISVLESMGMHYDSPWKYALIGCFVILLLEFGKLVNSNHSLARVGGVLGGVSMYAYLFHRQYFYIAQKLLGEIRMVTMYTFVIPLFFTILWFGRYGLPHYRSRLVG